MRKETALALFGTILIYSMAPAWNIVKTYTHYSFYKENAIWPTYRTYLMLMEIPQRTQLHGLIRQSNDEYPGDYFWPPNALLSTNPEDDGYNSPLDIAEKSTIAAFLARYVSPRYSDSLIITSLQGYFYVFPNGPRREFYTMFADSDTVFVVSGILGKFMSFYRAVPGDFRLSPDQFLTQVRGISSITDGLKIAEGDFTKKDDPDNYFLQYIHKQALIRLRNYQLEAVLPPAGPESRTPRKYNLIEITKIVDRSIIAPDGR